MKRTSALGPLKFGTILSLPRAKGFTFAGIPARMQLQGAALAVTLVIVAKTGSYTVAGILVAALTIGRAISAPALSRLVDKHGQFAIMSFTLLVQFAATALLAAGATWGWNIWLLGILAALMGLSTGAPPAFIRARWVGLVRSRPELDTAFAWESLIESFGVAVTPLIIVWFVDLSGPVSGLIFLAIIGVVGGYALFLQRGSEPKIVRKEDGRRVPISRRAAALIVVFTLYYLSAAIAMGAYNILAVEQGETSEIPGYTGYVLASFAVGTMVGAILYGSINWNQDPSRRFGLIIPLFAATTLTIPFLEGSLLLLVASFIIGLPFIAILTSTNRAVQEVAPAGRVTEMLAWLATALGVGIALGNLFAGVFVDLGGYLAVSYVLIASGALGIVTLLVQLLFFRNREVHEA